MLLKESFRSTIRSTISAWIRSTIPFELTSQGSNTASSLNNDDFPQLPPKTHNHYLRNGRWRKICLNRAQYQWWCSKRIRKCYVDFCTGQVLHDETDCYDSLNFCRDFFDIKANTNGKAFSHTVLQTRTRWVHARTAPHLQVVPTRINCNRLTRSIALHQTPSVSNTYPLLLIFGANTGKPCTSKISNKQQIL